MLTPTDSPSNAIIKSYEQTSHCCYVNARSLLVNRYITSAPTKQKSNIPEYIKVLAVPKFVCSLPPMIAPNDCPRPPYIAFIVKSIVAFIPGGLILCAYMLPEDQNIANVIPLRASAGNAW
mmetsp:Transcript_1924/g.3013  ORF Transcript_1924/g.3013 Transcript_1924/m.3013 type:complete len:121 (+) Transcript_1924:76-438(+)